LKKGKTTASSFICLECGKMGIPIHRKRSREKGHVKDLYCVHCGKVTHQMELRNNTSDMYEYNEDPELYIETYTKGKIREKNNTNQKENKED
jgi:predicted RNA-binding Zn-ribbon protein involved in translation (DUF1610 family)